MIKNEFEHDTHKLRELSRSGVQEGKRKRKNQVQDPGEYRRQEPGGVISILAEPVALDGPRKRSDRRRRRYDVGGWASSHKSADEIAQEGVGGRRKLGGHAREAGALSGDGLPGAAVDGRFHPVCPSACLH